MKKSQAEVVQEIQNIIKQDSSNNILPKFLLSGDLGAGKTTLVKNLLPNFGVEKADVISPTFIILRTYTSKDNIYNFAHFDFYRFLHLQKEQHINTILDFLENIDFWYYFDNYITFIEWPEFVKDLLPSNSEYHIYDISIDFKKDKRIYNINKFK